MKYQKCLLCLLVLVSCTKPKQFLGDISYEDIQNCRESKKLIYGDGNISIIPLESKRECLTGRVGKIVLTNEYYFIWSNNSILQFLRNGKFIRAIGNYGRGPQEYLDINDFTINEKEKIVFIADSQNIIQYNFEGDFISKYAVNLFWKFDVTDEGHYVINPINFFGNEPNKLIIINSSGDTLVKFKNSILYQPKSLSLWPQRKSILKIDKNYIYHQQFCDTIFTVNTNNLTLDYRYSFNFGNHKITNQALSEGSKAIGQSVYISDITEDLNYIYLACNNKGSIIKSLIDINSGKFYKPDFYIPEIKFQFWPKWQYQDSLLIDIVSASHIIEMKDSLPKSNLDSMIGKLNEFSNSLLIIVNSGKRVK